MVVAKLLSVGSDALSFSCLDSLWSLPRTAICILALVLVAYLCARIRTPSCYLVDFACIKGAEEKKTNLELYEYLYQRLGGFDDSDVLFQLKVFLNSGIGEETYVPPAVLEKGRDVNLCDKQEEAQSLIFKAVEELLMKTGMSPTDIDLVVLNCGLFSTVPSLTANLVNRFKMRTDVKTYNLSGMGCSAGLVALDLAKDLLRVNRNSYAVVVSTECLGGLYFGKERSMMVTNCLFRSGAAALLLSNKREDRRSSKFELLHSLRHNTSADDESFACIEHREDEEGNVGAVIGLNLIKICAVALDENIRRLAPKVLPIRELLKYIHNLVRRKVLKIDEKPYVPNFKLAFEHFCIHPGSRTVITKIGKSLKLSEYDMEPSLMALHRFGNTSSSGIWYILAYCEAKGRFKAGDRVWQIAVGSGFKCNSAVWKVLQVVQPPPGCNPWMDCVDRYPVTERLSNLPHTRAFIEALKNHSVRRNLRVVA